METRSKSDKTLFFQCLFLFFVLIFLLSIVLGANNFFNGIVKSSTKHILLAAVCAFVFIGLPLQVFSWTLTRFIVRSGEITVIEWFGLRKRIYTLPQRKELSIKRERAGIIFELLDRFGKYHDYKTLSFTTKEGKKLKVKSRFYKNFEELNVAIRKASY